MVSVAGLCLATRGQRSRNAAWLGFVFGAGLFGPMLHWTSTYVGAVPWLILVFAETWYTAAMAAALPLVQRLRWWPAGVAALWVTEEAVRDRFPFGGFPWGRWAFSQAESPLKWFAPLGGAPLVTFAVALAGALLAWAVSSPIGRLHGHRSGGRWLTRQQWTQAASGLVAAALVVLLGVVLAQLLRPDTGKDRTLTVAAIQGNVPDRGLEFDARRRQVLDNHVAQTLRLAAAVKAGTVARPDLVLWPENASDIDPTDNPDAAAEIQQAHRRGGRADPGRRHPGRSRFSACHQRRAWSGNRAAAAPRPGPALREAAPGAVRRVHPAAVAGQQGEQQGGSGPLRHGRRARATGCSTRPRSRSAT